MKKDEFISILVLWFCIFFLGMVGLNRAHADSDPSQAQDWTVDGFDYFGKGILTPFVLQTYTLNGHQANDGAVVSNGLERLSYRLFYGLTDNINFFGQLNTAKPNGQSFQLEGFEVGLHFKLYEQHPNEHVGWKLGLAWENEVQRAPQYVDVPFDIDWHPLIEYDVPLPKQQYISLLFNPIFERNIIGGAGWEGGWSAQMLYHWSRDFSAGVESYGDLGEFKGMGQEHNQGAYAMPVITWKWISLGVGIGLTTGSDRVVTKLNVGIPIDTSGTDVKTWF